MTFLLRVYDHERVHSFAILELRLIYPQLTLKKVKKTYKVLTLLFYNPLFQYFILDHRGGLEVPVPIGPVLSNCC